MAPLNYGNPSRSSKFQVALLRTDAGNFNINELKAALHRIKPKSSGGLGGVAPDLVQPLPKPMKAQLLADLEC